MAIDPISWMSEQYDKVAQHPGMRNTVARMKSLVGDGVDAVKSAATRAAPVVQEGVNQVKNVASAAMDTAKTTAADAVKAATPPPNTSMSAAEIIPPHNTGMSAAEITARGPASTISATGPTDPLQPKNMGAATGPGMAQPSASRVPPVPEAPVAPEPAGNPRMDSAKAAMREAAKGPMSTMKSIKDSAISAGKRTVGWLAKKAPSMEQIYNATEGVSRMSDPNLSYDEKKNEGYRTILDMGGTLGGGILGGIAGAGVTGYATKNPMAAGRGALAGGAVGADLGRRAAGKLGDWMLGEKKGMGIDDRLREAVDGPAGMKAQQAQAATNGNVSYSPQAQQAMQAANMGPQSGSIPDTSGYQASQVANNGYQGQQLPDSVINDPRSMRARGGSDIIPEEQWRQNKRGLDSSTTPAFLTKPDGSKVQYEVPQGGMLIQNDQTGETNAYKMRDPEAAKRTELARMAASNSVDRQFANAGMRRMPAIAPGPFGSMATLGAYGAASRMEKNKAELGAQKQAKQLEAMKFGYGISKDQRDYATTRADKAQAQANTDREFGQKTTEFGAAQSDKRKKEFDDDIKSVATDMAGNAPTSILGKTDDKAHAANISKIEAGLKTDVNYSIRNRKDQKGYSDLSGPEREQLFLAKKFKDKATTARGGMLQGMRDFFGNKQFDSKDLYSYIPDSVEPATLPGSYVVKLRNGNTAEVTALQGGGFKMLSANEPIDADMASIIQSKIKEHKAKKAK